MEKLVLLCHSTEQYITNLWTMFDFKFLNWKP